MKRQTRLSKVTSERDTYRAQVGELSKLVEAQAAAIVSGQVLIAKGEELMAHKDFRIALADDFIEKINHLHGYTPT